jgi:FixJ family two-component response regulator
MSGFDFAAAVNDIPQIANIPIIFVTAHATTEFVDKANNVGAVDFVVKPVKSNILLQKISDVLSGQEAAPEEE